MFVPEALSRIQETWLSQAIAESTWGYPIVGALHVLAIAVFGGAVLIPNLCSLGWIFKNENPARLSSELGPLRWIGVSLVVLTGILLFIARPLQYYGSIAFKLKVAILILMLLHASTARRSAWLSLVLWAAAIFAARGIAFF